MKIKRVLSTNIYKIYQLMNSNGLLEDCYTTEEVANAIYPMLSNNVDLSRCGDNYEEQILYFVDKLLKGEIVEYALVNRVTGTESYVTHSLEQDIRDIQDYMIIPTNEIDICDTVIKKSIIYSEVKELLDEIRQDEMYYQEMYDRFFEI